MNSRMIYQLEKKKYRRQGLPILLGVMVFLHILIAGVQLFQERQAGLSVSFQILRAFDGLAMFQVLLLPIFLASLVSISVQLENRHQMWKILQVSGVSMSQIVGQKVRYIWRSYVLAQVVEWGLVLLLVASKGWLHHVPWERLAWYGMSVFAVSFTILMGHVFLSLRWSNQLVSLAVAIVGSLVSLILLFLPLPLMWASPYAWYGYLISLSPEKVGEGFVYHLREQAYFPLIAGVVLSSLLSFFQKKMKERN